MKVQDIASHSLDDIVHLLEHISPQDYAVSREFFEGSSIGQHVRHILEFYQCLLLQIQQEPAVINYASRKRDKRIELDPSFALDLVIRLKDELLSLDASTGCLLIYDSYLSGEDTMSMNSSLERELLYNIEHTIHHLSIIRVCINNCIPHLNLPEHFGIAPATIKHREKIGSGN